MKRTGLLLTMLASAAAAPPGDYQARVAQVLKVTPLIDGRND